VTDLTKRIFLLFCAVFLLAGASSSYGHNLPLGGSKWCVGNNQVNATIDLNETLFSELRGIKEKKYSFSSGSESHLQQIAKEFVQPYVNSKISLSVNGRNYPVQVLRLVRNENSTYTIWLSASNLAFDQPQNVLKIDYRMLFEETDNAHVNLGYFYRSEATGEALQRFFDNSPAAGEHNFTSGAHVWELEVTGTQGAAAPLPGISAAAPAPADAPGAGAAPPKSPAAGGLRAPALPRPAPVALQKGALAGTESAAKRVASGSAGPFQEKPVATRAPAGAAVAPPPAAGAASAGRQGAPSSAWSTVGSFLLLGIEHILTGYDHIAFLVGLIVIGLSIREVLKIITAFTIAHSITLLLAALQVINLNSRLVESVIAISICYIALENLFRKEVKYRWIITFCFGLVHGFGFASALQELIVGKSNLLVSVLSFNLGVEAGQLMIFFLLLPLLYLLRQKMEPRRVTAAVSLVIFMLGFTWLIERLFDLNLIS